MTGAAQQQASKALDLENPKVRRDLEKQGQRIRQTSGDSVYVRKPGHDIFWSRYENDGKEHGIHVRHADKKTFESVIWTIKVGGNTLIVGEKNILSSPQCEPLNVDPTLANTYRAMARADAAAAHAQHSQHWSGSACTRRTWSNN